MHVTPRHATFRLYHKSLFTTRALPLLLASGKVVDTFTAYSMVNRNLPNHPPPAGLPHASLTSLICEFLHVVPLLAFP